MKALIIGNSQAQGAGAVLEGILKKKGYEVKRLAKHGAATKEILELYDSVQHPNYDTVVVFNWDATNADKLLQKFSGSPEIIWYGSPPATRITDVGLAKKVFGSKIKDERSWFESGYAKQREDYNEKLKKTLPSKVKYIDYRDLDLPNSVKQESGVSFPDLPDGIHIPNSIAKTMFAAPHWPSSGLAASKGVPVWVWWSAGVLGAFAASLWAWRRSRER